MYIGADAFIPEENLNTAKMLFKKSVKRVEVETHSFCNRRCDYCPNAAGDRLGENRRMDDDVWNRIIHDLSEINYNSNMVLNSYNEPLADRFILERLCQARAAMPNARLCVYTNGDYLNARYLDELAEAGLNLLSVSIHLSPGESFQALTVLNKFSELSIRIAQPLKFKEIVANRHVLAEVTHPKLAIELRGINYFESGTNRGNLVEGIKMPPPRTSPCYFPFTHFYVGYSGNIVPCCHIRSDAPAHQHYLIGNICEFGSVYQAYASTKAVAWRRHLISSDEKQEPCRSCSVPFLSDNQEDLEKISAAYRQYVLRELN